MRVIVEAEPNCGAWNMALDEALLESALQDGACTVRIYRWSEPTVSLGYFQKPDEIAVASPLAPLSKVRRLTGGGAILHHHEWTYSCTVPCGHPAVRRPAELYETVHRAIIDVLRRYKVEATLRGEANREAKVPAAAGAFLCFSRGDPRDVVLRGSKIVGSAQRRRKGAVLQHGSILLRASKHAPHLAGIGELLSDFGEPPELGAALGRSIAASLSACVTEAALSAGQRGRAVELQETRYDRLDWSRPVHTVD